MRIIGNDPSKTRQTQRVASGALTDGTAVIVNSDGTVSVVEEDNVTQAVGSSTVFESASVNYNNAAYDVGSGKVVVVYKDNGNSEKGTAVIGTISGTSISFGTPVVFESSTTNFSSVVYDPDSQKVIVAYSGTGSSLGYAKVGTVSGTSISFGSVAQFNSGITGNTVPVYDTTSDKVVIVYRDGSNSQYGTAIVGTVSGTSISFGSEVVFNTADTRDVSAVYDPDSNRVVVTYRDVGNSSYGTAIVGTVSGTSISFGSEVVFNSGYTTYTAATYDQNAQKVVVAYSDAGNSSYGTAIVGTVSGTSISFGTEVVFESAASEYVSAIYDSNAQKVVVSYRDDGNSNKGTLIVGTVSGTSISFGTPVVFEAGHTQWTGMAYDETNKEIAIAYSDVTNSNYGTAVVFRNAYTSTNLTAENYIGISSGGAVADTGNATVDIIGTVNKDQTGLTAGEKYYVQTDGTLSTTADDPSVFAGTAVSATKLIVKG